MIANNAFAMLENKPMQSKSGNSPVSDKSHSNDSNGFSSYMDKPPEKVKDKSTAKVEAHENRRAKSESKVENRETTRTEKSVSNEISRQDDEAVDAKGENADSIDPEAKNAQANVESVTEDEEKKSTSALVSLLLQRAIKSNIEESGDKEKGLEQAGSVIKAQTSALENLIKKSEADGQLSKDILQVQTLGDGKERLSPEFIKLMSLNKLSGENSRQEILSQMKLQSIDEVMSLNEGDGDLLAKLFDKLDLDKTKGELIFQNRMNVDKTLVSSDVSDSNLTKMGAEGVDRNLLAGATTNSAERVNAVTSMQQMKMSTPVSSPEWGAEFGKRIQMMMKNNIQHAEIRMDPPEMGRIHIKINISQDQANISFTALHANVREAIETNMTRLRDMLADTGMQLGDTDVGTEFQQQTNQSSDEQGQFSFQKQQSGLDGDVENTEVPTPVIQQSIDGVIDYFA